MIIFDFQYLLTYDSVIIAMYTDLFVVVCNPLFLGFVKIWRGQLHPLFIRLWLIYKNRRHCGRYHYRTRTEQVLTAESFIRALSHRVTIRVCLQIDHKIWLFKNYLFDWRWLVTILKWVSVTALGRPVVPLENWIRAMSSCAFMSAWGQHMLMSPSRLSNTVPPSLFRRHDPSLMSVSNDVHCSTLPLTNISL